MGYSDRREYMRKYQREWIARRRAEFFSDKSCLHCGTTERLELDHVDPESKVHHAIWSWSAVRREAEIAKCQILCHDCHLAKSKANGDLTRNKLSGETHGMAKLSDEQVVEARLRYAAGGVTHQQLADEYGVGRSTVTEAIRGTWRNITTPIDN